MTAPLVIGVDLGGTRLRAGLVTAAGEIAQRAEMPTKADAGPDAVVAQIIQLARDVARDTDPARIKALGICAPGPLDAQAGLALSTPTIKGFTDFPLRDRLADDLPWPVHLEHDGHAAAVAEWKLGAGRALRDLVYVTVSTGIGGGVVTDNRLLRGRKGMAGHIGHMVIETGGAMCPCGNRGCWEALASGSAFDLLVRERGFDGGAAVFDAAQQGDGTAQALVDQLARHLGIGMVNLIHAFSPDAVIMGGGVSNGFDQLAPGIRDHIARTAMAPFRTVELRRAELGDNSGLLGAALLAFDAL